MSKLEVSGSKPKYKRGNRPKQSNPFWLYCLMCLGFLILGLIYQDYRKALEPRFQLYVDYTTLPPPTQETLGVPHDINPLTLSFSLLLGFSLMIIPLLFILKRFSLQCLMVVTIVLGLISFWPLSYQPTLSARTHFKFSAPKSKQLLSHFSAQDLIKMGHTFALEHLPEIKQHQLDALEIQISSEEANKGPSQIPTVLPLQRNTLFLN